MSGTESASPYDEIDKMNTRDILAAINAEDRKVPEAVAAALPQLEKLVEATFMRLQTGGRLFYLGAGTSGRLGVVDASECPPTFGVAPDTVVGIIAGGDTAIRAAVENAEDDETQGWADLQGFTVSDRDIVVGIAASGRTPYVRAALAQCRASNIATGCIVCNANSPIADVSDFPVEIMVGPEFITGSTRMKAGTAQKLALNMLSTTVMVRLGRVVGNRMVHMQLSNDKLVMRGTQMIVDSTGLDTDFARALLLRHGSVAAALAAHGA